MAEDFPCVVEFDPGSGAESHSGTYGVMDESPILAELGLLDSYRVSVWTTSKGWASRPVPRRLVTVKTTDPLTGTVTSTSRQVLAIGQDDGVIMRLVLGVPNA